MVKDYRTSRILKAAAQTGYLADGHQKQICRQELIKLTKEHVGTPRVIFTLAGQEALCVELFRKHWQTSRIVSIDRYKHPVMFGPTERLGYEAYMSNFDDFAYGVNPPEDIERTSPVRRGMKVTSKSVPGVYIENATFAPVQFDFPKYDLAYLDFTAYPRKFDAMAHFVRHHLSDRALLGLTFTSERDAGRPGAAMKAVEVASRVLDVCPELSFQNAVDYETATDMIFITLTKNGSKLGSEKEK